MTDIHFRIGGRCLVEKTTGQWHPAVITSIGYDITNNNEKYFDIRYIANNEVDKVFFISGKVKELKPRKGSVLHNIDKLKLGLSVVAKYSVDGTFIHYFKL